LQLYSLFRRLRLTFVMRTGTSFKAGSFQASDFSAGGLGLFQEKSVGSVCTAASFDLFLFKYGLYEISSVLEWGSTNIHFPAGVAIGRAFLTSGSGARLCSVEEGLCRLRRSSSSLDMRLSNT